MWSCIAVTGRSMYPISSDFGRADDRSLHRGVEWHSSLLCPRLDLVGYGLYDSPERDRDVVGGLFKLDLDPGADLDLLGLLRGRRREAP